jgi:DNA-binding response OmpR family regulator
MNLLVVDDNQLLLDTIQECFQDSGIEVSVASTGEVAIREIVSSRLDVLVTDIDLGKGMNGLDLANRARERRPALPVLYISGRGGLLRRADLIGSAPFLTKPFSYKDLLREVRNLAPEQKVSASTHGTTPCPASAACAAWHMPLPCPISSMPPPTYRISL